MTPQERYAIARQNLIRIRLAWVAELHTNHFGLAKFAERAIAGVNRRIDAIAPITTTAPKDQK